MRIVVKGVILCCIFGSCINLCRADTLVTGSKFAQRIPAQGDGHAAMDPVNLFVSQHVTICDIDVYLDITHTEVSDLRIELETPWGETVMLKDVWPLLWKNRRSNIYDTIFDDDALDFLKRGKPPYGGRFRPAEGYCLSDLNGKDAYGPWTLRIYDVYLADFGTLDQWELYISHVPEPVSLIYLLAGVGYCYRRTKPPAHKKTTCL